MYESVRVNSAEVPQVPSAHGIHFAVNRKKLAVVLSPYIYGSGWNGGCAISVLLQTSNQPVRDACVSFRLSLVDGEQRPNHLFQRRCSCQQDIWSAEKVRCEHTDMICQSNPEDRLIYTLLLTSLRDRNGIALTDTRSQLSQSTRSLFTAYCNPVRSLLEGVLGEVEGDGDSSLSFSTSIPLWASRYV